MNIFLLMREYQIMPALLYEVQGLTLIVEILQSIIDDTDKDSPTSIRSKELLESVNEILENYIGIDNGFTSTTIRDIYYDFLLDLLDEIIGRGVFHQFLELQIKSVQLCDQNDDLVLLHIGGHDASK